MENNDLWPDDLQSLKAIAPVAILREQAAALGAKTKNVAKGKVEDVDEFRKIAQDYGPFAYSFSIVAPVLGTYEFRLFDISYDAAMYPVQIHPSADVSKELGLPGRGSYIKAEDESALNHALKQIFASKKTRQVVGAILSQSGID
jgi:hypothetical protein